MQHIDDDNPILHRRMILSFLTRPSILFTLVIGALAAFGLFDRFFAKATWLEVMIPAIPGHVQASEFPESARAYFSLMFPLGLVWLYEGLRLPRQFFVTTSSKIGQAVLFGNASRHIWVFLGVALCLAGAAIAFLIGGHDFNVIPFTTSRSALAVFGPIVSCGSLLLIAGSIKITQFYVRRGEG